MKLAKKTKRLLAYVGIIGGCAVLAMTFFTVSQFEKAKYQASENTRLMCQNRLNKILDADKTALEDTNTSAFHDAAVWWKQTYDDFVIITNQNAAAYRGTAIPAYIFSMGALVAFGLVLKHAEKAKEKEDEEAVLKKGEQQYET